MNRHTRTPPPGLAEELTDPGGTTLTVSANGDGTVLLELANEQTRTYNNVTLEPWQLVGLWRAMVDATGLTPNELRDIYRHEGLINPPKPPPSRQARRAIARKKPTHTGASFTKQKATP